MAERFLCSDALAGDMTFGDVEEILDALEAALVSADTPLFDSVRQTWQPVGLHPEVRTAWASRERYRPPGSAPLSLPPLPVPGVVEVDELAGRKAAYARVRSTARVENAPEASSPHRRLVALALVCGLLVLGMVGWAVVVFAGRLGAVAGELMRLGRK